MRTQGAQKLQVTTRGQRKAEQQRKAAGSKTKTAAAGTVTGTCPATPTSTSAYATTAYAAAAKCEADDACSGVAFDHAALAEKIALPASTS